MFHFFHQLITGSVSEYGEPVHIWAGLQIADRSEQQKQGQVLEIKEVRLD